MLKDYQIEIAKNAVSIIQKYGLAYLGMEVRTGKTRTALKVCELLGFTNVLFLTKKNAIDDIVVQYKEEQFKYKLTVTNYEQIHNLNEHYDFTILDEAHVLGGYPKPSEKTKRLKRIIGNSPVLYLSGTPWTESGSKLFHQFWVSKNTPFREITFYKWAKEYVDIKEKVINGYKINDYSHAKLDKILEVLKPYLISFSQSEAGFQNTEIKEVIKYVDIDKRIQSLVNLIIKDGIYTFKDGEQIICDSAVKKQSKIHQIFSGTVKTESGNYKILDYSKANYIKNNYKDKKIAVFYKFIAEGVALKEVLSNWTDNVNEFNNSSDKVFIKQIQSGSMGVNLSTADILIFYNIDFSVMQYLQAKARVQNMNKKEISVVHWLFAKGGIEEKIYKTLLNKKSYTMFYFLRDYDGKKGTGIYNKVS